MADLSLTRWGEPAPFFEAATPRNPHFMFSSLGGRFILLAFLGEADLPRSKAFLEALATAPHDDRPRGLLRFAVTGKKSDGQNPAVQSAFPDDRIFHDPDLQITERYGLASRLEEGKLRFSGGWYLIDPMMRIYRYGALENTDALIALLASLPEPADHAGPGLEMNAPALIIPRVLTPEFCRELINLYRTGSPNQSGFMRERDGRTVPVLDPAFKRRQDLHIRDQAMIDELRRSILKRVKPQIKKAFQFDATRIERYIVARYGAEEKGFFRPHRDDTTSGTAHRRFAVTINLNAEEFEGGELRFPEFGTRSYKAPTGGAVVFSCSLLHEALPVTKGERFATLPFLYDDAGAQVRQENVDKIDGDYVRKVGEA